MNSKAYGLAHINKYEEANELIDRVLSVDQNYAKAFDTKGFILLKQGDYIGAEKYLTQAVKEEPTYPKYKHLADLYEKLNKPDKARENRDKAAELRRKRYRQG